MSRQRLSRINSLITAAVSELLLTKSNDPRLSQVTITKVSVSNDMRKARIFYSCSNQETQRQKIAHALDKAKGYVRTYLGETLSLKFVPELIFEYDRNLDYVERVYKILDSVKKDSEETTEVSPIVDEDEEGEAEDREQARPAPKEA